MAEQAQGPTSGKFLAWMDNDELFKQIGEKAAEYKDEVRERELHEDTRKEISADLQIKMGVVCATSGLKFEDFDGIQASPIRADGTRLLFRRIKSKGRKTLSVEKLLAAGVSVDTINACYDQAADVISWKTDEVKASPLEMAQELARLRGTMVEGGESERAFNQTLRTDHI